MKMVVSIFLILSFPILVFADMLYFKDDTSLEGEIVAMRISQDESIIGTNEAQYQYKAKADAKEDFNSGIKWSEISILAFSAGLYVYHPLGWDNGPMGSAVAFAAPIAAVYLTPVDDIRLDNLSTKNEKHRNPYRSAYERETKKQRLKFSLIGTGCTTAGFGVYAVLNLLAIITLMGHQ